LHLRQRSAGLFLAGLVVQLISRLMWLFFGWLKLILMSQLLPGLQVRDGQQGDQRVFFLDNIRRRAAE
jgi:hypothetical protein